MQKIYNYINGQQIEAIEGAILDVYDPSTGKVYATAPASTQADVEAAVSAAKAAYSTWSKTSIDERYKLLSRIADYIERDADMLAAAESKDNGKPLWLAQKVDIPRASANFRFYANAMTQFASEAHEMTDIAINYTLRSPLGVVGCISPWNLPLYLFTWKIAPALATGNTVIAKPSEVTPMTAYMLGKICTEAGLPPGVLNILHGLGPDVGAPMTAHPEIVAMSFTGSTRVGKEIARVASPMFKKISLEMGGKNPNIIFDDCNYDDMLRVTLNSSFANQGQICLCGSRILVQRSIYDRFKQDFVAKAKKMVVGPPDASDTRVGAVVSETHMQKILGCIELAKEEGGTILLGGERQILQGDHAGGYYVQPTIIEGLGPDCRTNQEEIFGPVVTITPFDTEEEAIALANGTSYGLSATIWTENLSRTHRMAAAIDSGIVWVNTWLLRDLRTPFGGVKGSGVGREGGFEALRFFTEEKNVCIKYK